MMKKNLLIIACTFAVSLFFVQCNSKDNSKEKAQEKLVEDLLDQKLKEHKDGLENGTNNQFMDALRITMNTINKQCPIMVDEITRLDSCSMAADGLSVSYFYTLTNMELIDKKIFKESIKEILTQAVKTNPEMKILRSAKLSINYIYSDLKGAEITTVKITSKDYE